MFGNITFSDVIISRLMVRTVTCLKNMNQHKVDKISSYFTEIEKEEGMVQHKLTSAFINAFISFTRSSSGYLFDIKASM
jgi:hypothetical protein